MLPLRGDEIREPANELLQAAVLHCGLFDGRAFAAFCLAAGDSVLLDKCRRVSPLAAGPGAGLLLSSPAGLFGIFVFLS